MSIRVFDHIFGHKLLVFLPVSLALALGVLWTYKSYQTHYESSATIWAEKPADFTGASASLSDFNPYISPAANYAESMRELLGTDSFVEGVLRRVDGPANAYPRSRYVEVRSKTNIWPAGTHTVYILSQAQDAQLAAKIPQAIVDEFTVVFTNQLQVSAGQAAVFYQGQANSAKTEYEAATLALNSYVRTRPALANSQVASQSLMAVSDAEFGKLLLRQQTTETQYNSLLTKYSASKLAATTADATTAFFYVVDPPKVADYKTVPAKKALLVKPVGATAFGFMVAGALLLLTWRFDRKVRFPGDLASLGSNLAVVTLPPVGRPPRGLPSSFVRLGAAIEAGVHQLSIAPAAEDSAAARQ